MIITVGNVKGGVGKSTIATNLATVAAGHGRSVLLVDADVQASCQDFRALREADDIKVVGITNPTIHKDVQDFKFDLIIIDSGGRDSAVFRSAVLACNLLVIPVTASAFDIWPIETMIDLVQEVSVYDDNFQSRFLLNMVQAGTIMEREAAESLQEHEEIPMLETRIGLRAAFKHAQARGQGVIEYDPRSKAAGEIQKCYAELMEI